MKHRIPLHGLSVAALALVAWAIVARPSLALPPQEGDIDNARVIEMCKLGLDDEIVIAKIKTGHTKFSLGDSDLVALKQAGVSGKVIAAMLEASVLKEPHVVIDGNPAELHTLGQAKVGGRLGSSLSFGIKSVKSKAYLQGQHAAIIVSKSPNIEMELPPSDSVDNYILVVMDGKGDRRELEVGAAGGAVGAKQGIRAESIIKTSSDALGGRKFKISASQPLKSGEYILYIVGSADFQKGVFGKGYDFTVE
ncbi:MAG: hypothetical protein ACE145_12355 [Terriglobia bacterium]